MERKKTEILINKLHSCFVPLCIWNYEECLEHRICLCAHSMQFNKQRRFAYQTHFYLNYKNNNNNNGSRNFSMWFFFLVIITIIIGTDVCFPNYRKTGCYALLETTTDYFINNIFSLSRLSFLLNDGGGGDYVVYFLSGS